MPNVYIINKGAGHNFEPAKEFGTLIYLSEGWIDRLETGTMHRAFTKLLDSSLETDFIVLTSLSVMCSMACAIFAAKHHRLNLLLYKGRGEYVKRETFLDGRDTAKKE